MSVALYNESTTDEEKITLVDDKKSSGQCNNGEQWNNVHGTETSVVDSNTWIARFNSKMKLYTLYGRDMVIETHCVIIIVCEGHTSTIEVFEGS